MSRHRRPMRRPGWVTTSALAALGTAAALTGTALVAATGAPPDQASPSGRQVAPVAPPRATQPPTRQPLIEAPLTAPPTTAPPTAAPPTAAPPPVAPDPTEPRVRLTPLTASEPARLSIPAINVDVDVMDLGLTDAGTLEVPPGAFPAGWYDGSPTPGELGPAIVAGHVRYGPTPGVFARLAELDVGDLVSVLRDDGTTAEFTVTRTEVFAKDAFPTGTVYGDIGHAGLRLITCGGLDASSGVFEDNVVVFAELSGGS